MAGCGMVRRTPPSGRVPFAYPALHPAPVPPVLAGQEQDARLCKRPSGRPWDLVQQMQEQPGRERRARAVLDCDLPRASDLELAEKTSRRRPDHRSRALKHAAPAVSPALAAIIAAVEASLSPFC